MSVTSLRKYKKKTAGDVSAAATLTREEKKPQHRCRIFLQLWWWWSSAVATDVCLILSWWLIAAMTRPTGDWALIKILGKLCWGRRMDGNGDWLRPLPNKTLSHKSLKEEQPYVCSRMCKIITECRQVRKCRNVVFPDYKLIQIPHRLSNSAVKVVAHSTFQF